MEKGWEIRYRGGNSMCTTPSDLDVIVADMPVSLGGKSSTPWLGPPTRYSIATRVSGAGDLQGAGAHLRPLRRRARRHRGRAVGADPRAGCRALGRYGVTESEVQDTPGPVIVPEAVE